jgi:hypothetical protein
MRKLPKITEMVDGTKIKIVNIDVGRLLHLPILDFKCQISKTSGEINENVFIAEYNHCRITIKKNTKEENLNGELVRPHVLFTGSIHKMWNELNGVKAPNYKQDQVYKGFNGNQFGLNAVIEVRRHLEALFDCSSNQMIFENIELGVNIAPSFNPKLFLKGLLFHRDKYFEFRYNGNYAHSIHQRFTFKIYDKSQQYNMSNDVLRVELKIVRMEDLKSVGIKTFEDIKESTLDKAKCLLIKRFKEIMHYDYTIHKKKLSKKELQKLQDYSNPRYWIEDLKPNHRGRHKDCLRSLTLKHSDKLHQQIENKIIEKCVIINRLSIKDKCVINNSECIGLNITQLVLKN